MKKIGIIGGLGPEATKEAYYAGVPILNTTKIHVDAIVKYCVEETLVSMGHGII